MRLPKQVKQAKEVIWTGEKKIYDWKGDTASCGGTDSALPRTKTWR